MPENAQYIEDMFKLARDLKINRLLFMAEMFNLPEAEAKSRELLSLGPEDVIYMEKKDPPPPSNYAEIMQNAYRLITKLRKKYKILAPLYPALSQRKPQEFFNRKYTGRLICKSMKQLIVSVDGNVYVCPFIHCKVGNFLEEPISEIWNNEKMQKLRRTILQNRTLLPICHSCCSIEEL
jgi:radical SAM protein with 4Fe4S-binding SPASM domain